MTVTTLEPITIEHLDFEPACSSEFCASGYPPATHSLAWPGMACGCYGVKLFCNDCTQRYRSHMAAESSYVWRCRVCQRRYWGYLRDLVEIRPL